MARRTFLNIKEKIRAEEENTDRQLKDAGLWEEGLTVTEKQQLLDLIVDSKNSAKEEESRRLNHNSFSTKDTNSASVSNEGNRKILEKSKNDDPVSEDADSDPVITFESPSASRQRKDLISSVGKVGAVSPQKVPLYNDREISLSSEGRGTNPTPTKCRETIREISSLFSNNSITARYIPSSTKSPGNLIHLDSKTDEDSNDENTDPLILEPKTSEDCVRDKDSKKHSQNDNTQSDTAHTVNETGPSLNKDEEKCIVNKLKICSLNSSVEIKSVRASDTQMKTVQESSSDETSFVASQHISDPDTPEPIEKITPFKGSVLSHSKKMTSVHFNPFSRKICNSTPLQRKVNLKSEKQNNAYFKAPFETDTKCMKRIYSLITEWQSALIEYQKTLHNRCKWGAPITIDRQLKDTLVKNKNVKFTSESAPVVYASDSSCDSETQISEQSDDDWIFPKKRKFRTARTYSRKNAQPTTRFKAVAQEQVQGTHNVNSDETNKESKSKDTEDTSDRGNSKIFKESSSQTLYDDDLSQRLLDEPTVYPSVSYTKFYSKKVTRKTFQIFSDEESDTQGNKTPDLFDSQPKVHGDVTCTNNEKPKPPPNDPKSPIKVLQSELPSNTTQEVLKRSSIKRKFAQSPLNIPPAKRAANKPEDIVVEGNGVAACGQLKKIGKPLNNATSSVTENEELSKPSTSGATSTSTPTIKKDVSMTKNKLESTNESRESTGQNSKSQTSSVQCPLCQKFYSYQEIEAHASECNGPVEEKEPKIVSTRSRVNKDSSERQSSDVLYLETHKKTSSSLPSKKVNSR